MGFGFRVRELRLQGAELFAADFQAQEALAAALAQVCAALRFKGFLCPKCPERRAILEVLEP